MNTNTKAHMRNAERNTGIDVGKYFLDICIYELGLHWQVENHAVGIKQLLIKLNRYKLTRIVVEATGGYERLVAQGKNKKVALTACMRKMMTILNTMVRNNQEWQMN